MKTPSHIIGVIVSAIAILTAVPFAYAGTATWTGGGGSASPFWLNTANWNPASVPQTGDDLVFTNNNVLANSNNIPSGSFNSITFATPSGAFVLKGSATTITGGITNKQANTLETVEFPIVDTGSINVDVTANGALTLTNTISGGGSLSKSGNGALTLRGANTFTGVLAVNGGTVVINADTNLNAPPVTPTAGNIVLNGGALETTTTMGLNTNRGIALGPTSGSGFGTLSVDSLTTLTNSSIMANNGGGVGGLTKIGFGNLILFGANTYTGPTTNTIGSIILDFTKPTAPANDIINSSSSLVMGGGNAGPTTTNLAQLIIAGTSAGNSQSFASSFFTLGASVIGVTNLSGGGTATLNLGALGHNPNSGLTFFSSPSPRAVITTTSGNTGGILGGWATIAGDADGPSLPSNFLVTGTNWATVDLSGHIVNFNNYYVMDAANHNTLHAAVDANTTGVATNILVGDATAVAVVATNDIDDAGTTTDINSIKIWNSPSTGGSGVYIGRNNTLRLGVYGGILSVQTVNTTPVIGGVSNLVNGVTANQAPFGSQDVGILTAGGPNNNTDGEIVITHSTTQGETTGGLIIAAQITDNGSGKVTVVKMGNGSIKLDGNNTYSGGLYMLQGRVQWQGTEIFGTGNGGPGGTNGLNDGAGFGPVYVLPGAYFAPSTSIPNITNDFYIAGAGDAQEKFGAFRGGNFGGNITMIGDATLCSDSANVFGPIHGPFNFTIGAPSRNGNLSLASSDDDWSGNTFMAARNSLNTLISSNNEVIPNGFGKGNVTMQGAGSANFIWNMNGFNETVNGFLSTGVNASALVVTNSLTQPLSILTIGDNDQSGQFGGIIKSNIAVTKIGAGVETFTNANSYFGDTTISGGVLQLSGGNASLVNSSNINIYGGTFDVSGVTYAVPASQTISVSNGTLFISSASSASSPVNMTNSTLKVTALSVGTPNLTASTINLGGSTNIIQPANIPLIDVYPKTFLIASYNTLNGDTNTLGVVLPPGGFPAFAGYVTVDTTAKQILLVMTAGPITPSLTWAGFNFSTHTLDGTWNFLDPNWTNKPAHTSASYSDGSLLTFDDSASTGSVNLTALFTPVGVTVTNGSLDYTFSGVGAITGTNGVTKLGSGKLTLDNTGGDSYNGLSIGTGGGVVQLGINDNGGSLGTNTVGVGSGSTLVFNRNNSVLNISNAISGSGGILVSNAASTMTVLSGNNGGYSGSVYVVPNVTLAPANANALSSTNGTLTIPTSATLDVGGLGVAANALVVGKSVQVSGAGVDSASGAIVNSTTTNQQNALLRVTLTGNTTFGGAGRWDIRGTGASLNGAYNLTKVGAGQVSIVGASVDPLLGDIDVQQGTLSIETTTTSAGDPTKALRVESGATLQIYNITNKLNKQITLVGDGATVTLNNGNGNGDTIIGPMTLSNQVVINGANNTTLTLSNAITDLGTPASLTKTGTNSTLVLSGNASFSGGTIVNDGTLLINGISSGSQLTENNSQLLPGVATVRVGGSGTNAAAMDIEDTLWPGLAGKPATFSVGASDGSSQYNGDGGALVWGYTGGGVPKAIFSLGSSTNAGAGINDMVAVRGDFNGNISGRVQINPLAPLSTVGSYTLVTYSGSKLNNFNNTVSLVDAFQPSRYTFSLTYDTVNKKVLLNVLTGAGSLVWNNGASTGIWDTNNNANWFNSAIPGSDVFLQLDSVTFDDSIGAGVTAINVAVTNIIPGTVTVNSGTNYTFYGPGSIGGATTLVKQGAGTLTISNANAFTGNVTVSGGTLAANGNNALGSGALNVYGGTVQANGAQAISGLLITNGTVIVSSSNSVGAMTVPVYITNSGTFDIGGNTVNEGIIFTNASGDIKQFIVSGWGVNSNGAIINSGPVHQQSAFQSITMTGNTAFGGPGFAQDAANSGRWDMRGTAPVLSTGGNAYNLYKVGLNQVSLVGTTVDTNLADIHVYGGEFGVETTTSPTLGNPNNTITMETGTSFEMFNFAGPLNKNIVLNGGQMLNNSNRANLWFNSNTGGTNNVIISPVIVTNGLVAIGGAAAGTLSNVVSGPGSLLICGPVILFSANTYSGNTTLSNNGTLFLTNNATIDTTPTITILGGTVNAAGRANNTLTLAGSQTLSGYGTVAGTLTVPSGTTLTVGTNGGLTHLTVTTNVNLNGTLNMKLDQTTATNDVLAAGGQINYNGTLNLNNLSGTLAVNNSFKLFNATTYSGSFSSITPAHPNNDTALNWDTSLLTTDGSIKVVGSGPGVFTQTPTMTSISFNGVNITATVTNAQAGDGYYLLSTTNLTSPWKVVSTNIPGSVGPNGSFTFIGTNVVDSSEPQKFYILVSTNAINALP